MSGLRSKARLWITLLALTLTQEHTMIRSSDWTTTQVVFVPQFNTHNDELTHRAAGE
jgi:hypothetical protein